MRKFKITVNGTEYEVTVEETTDKCDQLPDENENGAKKDEKRK